MPVTLRGMETGPERLGRLVRERRRQLRLTQRQAAERGGISEQTWGVVENAKAETYADLTLSAVDIGLGWAPGSAEHVLDDPDYLPGPTPTIQNDRLLEDVEDLLRRVRETLDSRRSHWDRLGEGEDEGRGRHRNSGSR